jgi:hypothetical protein
MVTVTVFDSVKNRYKVTVTVTVTVRVRVRVRVRGWTRGYG